MAVMPPPKRRKLSPLAEGKSEDMQKAFFKQAAGWNLEQDYEQRPRKKRKEKEKENLRLPVKTAEGRIERLPVPEPQQDDPENWLESEKDEAENALVPEEPSVPIRQQILDAKEELARLAILINEDPEEHADVFKALGSVASSRSPTIKKLALATQLSVYKDVIPGYRIRPITEENQTERVSKDVKKLRFFEQALVSSYQSYLKDLAVCARRNRKDSTKVDAVMATVAISCACALLLAVPHFNFRGELLKIVIGKLSGKRIGPDFVKCRDTLVQFFRDDDDGARSLDAVGLLARMMKARNFQIHESVLNTFLHLRLLSEFSNKASQTSVDKVEVNGAVGNKKIKAKKEFRTKRHRKILKERKAVEKDFKEADAIVSHEQRDRMQAETLKIVFVTYFRILKARIPHLMGAVLEGLARYAHLINQDFFGDLLEALKDLIRDAEEYLKPSISVDEDENDDLVDAKDQKDGTREALLCITTGFALLEGQDAARSASTLNLDLTFFTSTLYKSLHTLSLNPDLELSSKTLRLADPEDSEPQPLEAFRVNAKTTSALLLRALASVLTSKGVPPVRLAAFTKQVYTSSLHLPEKSTLATMGLTNNIVKTHGRKIGSLFDTEERRGDGIFDPWRGDLESSNPFASTIWEGELLRLHFSPGVRESARAVEKVLYATK